MTAPGLAGTTPRARLAVLCSALALLAGCASSSPAASAAGSADGVPAAACPSIELRSPGGTPVQLTGRWHVSDGGTYFLRQSGSCIWITGFSVDAGAPGEGTPEYTNALFGHLDSDFTFSGLWVDTPWGAAHGGGSVTWRLHFADVGGEETITLRIDEQTGGTDQIFVVRAGEEADLQVRLINREGCTAVVTDNGTVYELYSSTPEWRVADGVFGPSGRIDPSDSLRVVGEVTGGIGACGEGPLLFADQIDVSAAP